LVIIADPIESVRNKIEDVGVNCREKMGCCKKEEKKFYLGGRQYKE